MIYLEPAVFTTQSHMSQWYQIRSETSVRYGCRSVKKITPEEHREWWEASMKNPARMLFFIREHYEDQGMAHTVGILRLDHRGDWTEAWLAVRPSDRRRKIATQAIILTGEKVRNAQWPPLGAIVSGKNIASWRLFARAGFTAQKGGWIQLIQRGRS